MPWPRCSSCSAATAASTRLGRRCAGGPNKPAPYSSPSPAARPATPLRPCAPPSSPAPPELLAPASTTLSFPSPGRNLRIRRFRSLNVGLQPTRGGSYLREAAFSCRDDHPAANIQPVGLLQRASQVLH